MTLAKLIPILVYRLNDQGDNKTSALVDEDVQTESRLHVWLRANYTKQRLVFYIVLGVMKHYAVPT